MNKKRKNKNKYYWLSKKDELMKLKARGVSYAELGRMFGVCKSRVFYIFKMFDTLEKQ